MAERKETATEISEAAKARREKDQTLSTLHPPEERRRVVLRIIQEALQDFITTANEEGLRFAPLAKQLVFDLEPPTDLGHHNPDAQT